MAGTKNWGPFCFLLFVLTAVQCQEENVVLKVGQTMSLKCNADKTGSMSQNISAVILSKKIPNSVASTEIASNRNGTLSQKSPPGRNWNVTFTGNNRNSTIDLLIREVLLEDAGVYKCRVLHPEEVSVGQWTWNVQISGSVGWPVQTWSSLLLMWTVAMTLTSFS